MKKLTTLCLTYAISMQAAMANHPMPSTIDCAPYAAEVRAARDTVQNFGRTVEEIRERLQAAQNKLYERQSLLSAASNAKANAQARIAQIDSEVRSLRESTSNDRRTLGELHARKVELEREIAEVRESLRNLPGPRTAPRPRPRRRGTVVVRPGGTTTVREHSNGTTVVRPGRPGGRVVTRPRPNSHAREVLTRRLNELSAQLTRTNARITRMESALQPTNARIAQLMNERRNAEASLAQASNDLAAAQSMTPAIEVLQERVARISERLATQDQVQAGNLAVLAQVEDKLLMCKTYTVKYPTVLEQAREITRVGCRNYQMPREAERRPFMRDAINEIFQVMCNR